MFVATSACDHRGSEIVLELELEAFVSYLTLSAGNQTRVLEKQYMLLSTVSYLQPLRFAFPVISEYVMSTSMPVCAPPPKGVIEAKILSALPLLMFSWNVDCSIS